MASKGKLPSLEGLACEAKWRKTVLSNFSDAYTLITTTNLCELQSRKLDKLSENAKVCWLTGKFGSPSIAKLLIALKCTSASTWELPLLCFLSLAVLSVSLMHAHIRAYPRSRPHKSRTHNYGCLTFGWEWCGHGWTSRTCYGACDLNFKWNKNKLRWHLTRLTNLESKLIDFFAFCLLAINCQFCESSFFYS